MFLRMVIQRFPKLCHELKITWKSEAHAQLEHLGKQGRRPLTSGSGLQAINSWAPSGEDSAAVQGPIAVPQPSKPQTVKPNSKAFQFQPDFQRN